MAPAGFAADLKLLRKAANEINAARTSARQAASGFAVGSFIPRPAYNVLAESIEGPYDHARALMNAVLDRMVTVLDAYYQNMQETISYYELIDTVSAGSFSSLHTAREA